MAQFVVLSDFIAGPVRLRGGSIVDDGSTPDIEKFQQAGLSIAPLAGNVAEVIRAYLSQRGNSRRDLVHYGDLLGRVLSSTGGASFVFTLSGENVEDALQMALERAEELCALRTLSGEFTVRSGYVCFRHDFMIADGGSLIIEDDGELYVI